MDSSDSDSDDEIKRKPSNNNNNSNKKVKYYNSSDSDSSDSDSYYEYSENVEKKLKILFIEKYGEKDYEEKFEEYKKLPRESYSLYGDSVENFDLITNILDDGLFQEYKQIYNPQTTEQYEKMFKKYQEQKEREEVIDIDDSNDRYLSDSDSSGSFLSTTKNGTYLDYYENNELKSIKIYEKGELNGECQEYFQNGKLKSIINYKDGELDGKSIDYNIYGNKIGLTNYKKGKKHGLEEEYDDYPHLIRTTNYKKDQKDGLEQIYKNFGEQQKVIRKTIYKKGVKHSEIIYNEFGNQIVSQKNYKNGGDDYSSSDNDSITGDLNLKIFTLVI